MSLALKDKMKISGKLILFSTLLAAVIAVGIWFEINRNKHDLLEIMNQEADNLVSTLSANIENSILTNTEVESLLISRLNSVAALVGNAYHSTLPSRQELQSICKEFGISHISIINGKGKVIASTVSTNFTIEPELIEELQPLYSHKYNMIDYGLINFPDDTSEFYLVARATKNTDRVAFVGFDNDKLMEFRNKIGIGKKIKDIASHSNIVYALLQDTIGIIAGSQHLLKISAVDNDAFLKNIWKKGAKDYRIFKYDNKEVYEAVTLINMPNFRTLLRVGVSLDKTKEIQQNASIRSILIGVGIFVSVFMLIFYISNRQKYYLLQIEHENARDYFNNILSSMEEPVISLDNQLRIITVNRAAEVFFGRNDLLDKFYTDIFANDELKFNTYKNSTIPNIMQSVEIMLSNQSKRIADISWSVAGKTNDTRAFICLIFDQTEKFKLSEEIHRKDKISAMGELARGVAHEIRNPLNAISMIAQRFEFEFEPKDDTETYKSLAKTIVSETLRVNHIIKQFLEFARPPQLDINSNRLDLCVKESVELIETKAKSQGITVETQIPNEIVMNFDNQKIKQALINILQNSIEAMPKGGQLCVSLSETSDGISISIKDNGVGISPEHQSKIFNLYFTNKQNGNGLGLSIVHQIISEHNGRIEVISAQEKGTEFIITLPY